MAAPTDAAAQPVALFQGYDRVRGDGRSMALTGTFQSSGASISSSYQVCKGMQEVMKELSISQSLTVGFLGIFSVSQKLEFLQRQRLTSHSVSIVVSSKRTERVETVTNVALHDGVEVPFTEEELAEFLLVYGDSYVSSRTTGGEYFGVYSFYSETFEEQQEVVAGMEAQGILKAFVGDAGLQTKISEFRHSQNMSASFDQTMTGVMKPTFPDAEAVIDFALEFPSLELTAPQLTQVETTSYRRVPGIATRFSTIAHNVDTLTSSDFAAQLMLAQELRARIAPILRVYKFYMDFKEDPKLLQVHKEVEADIEATLAIVKAFEEHPARPIGEPPQFVSLRHGTPSLDFVSQSSTEYLFGNRAVNELVQVDTMGGDIAQCLQRRTAVVAVEMLMQPFGMDQVMGLRMVVNNGKRTWNAEMGGVLDAWRYPVLQLHVPSGQFVKSVRGRLEASSRNLAVLRIELTNGASIANGNFNNPALEFLETPPQDYFLIGFRASHSRDFPTISRDRTLRSLQMVYVKLRPAVWALPNV